MDIGGSPVLAAYSARYGCGFVRKLGFGREGDVFQSDRPSAVKFFHDRRQFDRELKVYQLLSELNIESIAGHAVPKLVRHDSEYRAIEMSIVTPPFLLDFAGARLEHEIPDFEPHVEEEHLARLMDLYGDRWQDVLTVADAFTRATGYVLMDIKPGNITF
jgi:hypothetical protein